jgi:hypothetical protein
MSVSLVLQVELLPDRQGIFSILSWREHLGIFKVVYQVL